MTPVEFLAFLVCYGINARVIDGKHYPTASIEGELVIISTRELAESSLGQLDRKGGSHLDNLPLRILDDWSLDHLKKERQRVAGKLSGEQRYLEVLDQAIATKQAAGANS